MTIIPLKAIALIPARYGSTRLKAKALAKIHGIAMIEHVYRNMSKGTYDVAVVTDHDEIQACIQKIGGKVFRVDDDLQTGSERIGFAYKKYLNNANYDFIVNVQGDEPLLTHHTIEKLLQFHARSTFDITTLTYPRFGDDELHNPNTVKIALEKTTGRCLYFSRSPIPYYRQNKNSKTWEWYQHVGVYSFRPNILMQFMTLPPSPLELAESLEQLRALEYGLRLGATTIDHLPQSVDTAEDLLKVESILNNKKE